MAGHLIRTVNKSQYERMSTRLLQGVMCIETINKDSLFANTAGEEPLCINLRKVGVLSPCAHVLVEIFSPVSSLIIEPGEMRSAMMPATRLPPL